MKRVLFYNIILVVLIPTFCFAKSGNQPEPDVIEQIVFNNWGKIALSIIAIYLLLQYGSSHETDDTNMSDLLNPDYRTAFVSDYHGDDAFEVPEGVHSEHRPVPVRVKRPSKSLPVLR